MWLWNLCAISRSLCTFHHTIDHLKMFVPILVGVTPLKSVQFHWHTWRYSSAYIFDYSAAVSSVVQGTASTKFTRRCGCFKLSRPGSSLWSYGLRFPCDKIYAGLGPWAPRVCFIFKHIICSTACYWRSSKLLLCCTCPNLNYTKQLGLCQ